MATTKAANTGNGYPSGMKNRIINGGMDISQRGTTFTAAVTYTLDRWYSDNITDAAITVTQNADAPSTNEFQNSLRMAVTTADASITAGQYCSVGQPIEGYNIRDLIGRTFTVSFWVRSSKTGIHCWSFQNTGGDRCYIAEYAIIASNTWEYKTITVTGGLVSAGTWNYTNGNGMYARFHLATGTTWQGIAGWNNSTKFATSNQVNCLDTIGNIFAITGVQLEVGAVATPFEHRLFGAELALCQRYFCKNSDIGVFATNGAGYSTSGMFQAGVLAAYQANNGYTEFLKFPVNIRSVTGATATFYNTSLVTVPTAGNISVYDGTNWVNAVPALQSFTQNGFNLLLTGTWATGARMFYFGWTVNAEL